MESIAHDYTWEDLLPHIITGFFPGDNFHFTMYAHEAPYKGEKILRDGNTFVVDSVTDCTDDDEREQGLSFSKVWISRI